MAEPARMSDPRPPRLALRGMAKAFAGVPVLDAVSFDLGAGEVMALLGANGAGKSTLVKLLCGLHRRDAGEVSVDGAVVDIRCPADAIKAGIRLIPQEISVHPDMTVADNVSLGRLPLRRWCGLALVDTRAQHETARRLLGRLGLGHVAPDRRMSSLGLPEQRVVEIARALAGDARILVMDEPTAALAEAEAEVLFAVITALRRDGVSIIYISHDLDEVFRLTDRIVVLRDGRLAGRFDTRTARREAVLEAMLGSRQGDLFPRTGATRATGPVLLEVEALRLPGWLEALSLAVRGGEVLGVFGLIGSGAEKLGRAIFGAEPAARWRRMRVNGADLVRADPAQSVGRGLGFVAAERQREGLVGILTVRENTTAPFLQRFVHGGQVDVAAERVETRRWIEALGVRTRGPEQEIRHLSGGNQQKVCLARWLLGDVRVLILEEPTRGVDLGARREIYAEVRKLCARGVAILLMSSDAEEVAGLADRVLVLDHGRSVAAFDEATTARALIEAASRSPATTGAADVHA